jgi:hypothetical protein
VSRPERIREIEGELLYASRLAPGERLRKYGAASLSLLENRLKAMREAQAEEELNG